MAYKLAVVFFFLIAALLLKEKKLQVTFQTRAGCLDEDDRSRQAVSFSGAPPLRGRSSCSFSTCCFALGCPDILGLCRKPSGFGCNVADFSAQMWLWESTVGGSGVPALSPIGYSRHCSVLVRLSACLGLLCR